MQVHVYIFMGAVRLPDSVSLNACIFLDVFIG